MATDTVKTVRGTLSNALSTLYTVPALTTAVLKRIDCENTHATLSQGVQLTIAGTALFPAPGQVIAALDGGTFEGTENLNAGETVRMAATTNGYVTYSLTVVETA